MAKKTLQTHYAAHQHFVIAVGYVLFACIALGLLTGTVVPMAHIFTTPHVRILNVVVFMVSLVIGALLPPLIAYIAGDAGTRSRNRQIHHYNGVMFGVLAYWIDTAFAILIGTNIAQSIHDALPEPLGTVAGFLLPVLAVALVVGILAFYYHRGGKQVRLLEYRPFQFVLIGTLLVFFVGILTQQYLSAPTGMSSLLISIAIFIGIVLLSYAVLMRGRGSVLQKIILAVTGATLGQVAFYTASQFAPSIYSIDGNVVQLLAILLASVMVWAVYLYITRLSYHK